MYQQSQFAGGNGSGTAALSLRQALARQPAIAAASPTRWQELDLVTDLGVRIGSKEWLRGFAICVGLCAAAWSLAPGLGPIAGASPAPLADAQWEQARTLTIAPLAYGGDTGRRMAATDAVQPLADTPERPRIDLVATLGLGDGFARVLERAGVAQAEAERVADLVGASVPLTDVKPGTAIDLTLGRRPNKQVPRPIESLSFRARFDLKLAVAREDGALRLTQIPIAVDDTPLRIQGDVGSSLYRAARAAGAPAKAVEAYLRAMATQLSVDRIGADDRFDIILEHRRAATGETETGKLLYAGLARPGGKDIRLLQWTSGGQTQWFEASGVGKSQGMFQRPVPGKVSSNFGMRFHPILGFSRMHKGMDFRAGYGTPILAAADGTVAAAGWHGGYGRQVSLNHGGGLVTTYSHMSRIAAAAGAHVRRGQVIGYVGATGLATGPHLHYEVHVNGVAVNPAKTNFITRAQLSGDDLARFRGELNRLLSVKPGAGKPKVQTAGVASETKPTA